MDGLGDGYIPNPFSGAGIGLFGGQAVAGGLYDNFGNLLGSGFNQLLQQGAAGPDEYRQQCAKALQYTEKMGKAKVNKVLTIREELQAEINLWLKGVFV